MKNPTIEMKQISNENKENPTYLPENVIIPNNILDVVQPVQPRRNRCNKKNLVSYIYYYKFIIRFFIWT